MCQPGHQQMQPNLSKKLGAKAFTVLFMFSITIIIKETPINVDVPWNSITKTSFERKPRFYDQDVIRNNSLVKSGPIVSVTTA